MWEMDAAECVPAFDLDSVISSSCSTVAVVSVLVSLTCNFLTALDRYVSFMGICDCHFAHCCFFAYFSKEYILHVFPHKLSSLMALMFFGWC